MAERLLDSSACLSRRDKVYGIDNSERKRRSQEFQEMFKPFSCNLRRLRRVENSEGEVR
jgi:hypothetical protein